MMKRFLAVMFSVMLVFSMTACSDEEITDEDAVVEDVEADVEEDVATATNSLLDVPKVDTPDLSDTVWEFCGGCEDGQELDQDRIDQALEAYGGVLQFAFDADGGAQMIQGSGVMEGTYQYLADGSVGVIFDNGGNEIRYACVFTGEDEVIMIAVADSAGQNGIYFVQQ